MAGPRAGGGLSFEVGRIADYSVEALMRLIGLKGRAEDLYGTYERGAAAVLEGLSSGFGVDLQGGERQVGKALCEHKAEQTGSGADVQYGSSSL